MARAPRAPRCASSSSSPAASLLPRLLVLAAAAAAVNATAASPSLAALEPKGAVVWLYAPTATRAKWESYVASLSAHRANVTGAAPCSYLMSSSGAWTTQFSNASQASMAANYTLRLASPPLSLAVYPLIAASGTGMNLALADASIGDAFIAASVAEAVALNLSGYNLQLEEPGNATIAIAWLVFLRRWLLALAAAPAPPGGRPRTLAVIIGGDCRGKDWMYVDCGDYRAVYEAPDGSGANLRVISEATYEMQPRSWLDYLSNLARGLGQTGLLQPGLEYGPPADRPTVNGCLPAAAKAGVRSLYYWVDPPDQSPPPWGGDAAWAGLGWWLHESGP